MRRLINYYLKNEVFPDKEIPNNQRYKPSNRAIYNKMFKHGMQKKFSKIDQANIEKMVEERQKKYTNEKIFFRPHEIISLEQLSTTDDPDALVTLSLKTDHKVRHINIFLWL